MEYSTQGSDRTKSTLQHRPEEEALSFREGGRVVSLRVADILWAESRGNYLRVHMRDGLRTVRGTMTALQGQLPAQGFLRIHRTMLVNVQQIREYRTSDSGNSVLMADGEELSVSRRLRGPVHAVLGVRHS